MKSIIVVLAAVFTMFITGCNKSDKQTSENKDKQSTEQKNGTLQTSAGDKSVEIHTSGMTCTGCESTIKSKVKKVDGVKDVMADHNTGTVKASYDPGKTNPDAIKNAITDAGYNVESIK